MILIGSNSAEAAPDTQISIFKNIAADQDIAGMLVDQNAIYLYGNTSSGAYVTAFNKDGSQKWLHNFSDQVAFTITSGGLDSTGNIWLVGASAAPMAIATVSPSAGANPDSVLIGAEGAIRSDLNILTLWKIGSTGEGAGKYQLPLSKPVLPTSLSLNKSGISIVAWQSAGSLFVTADLAGTFGKPIALGKSTTTIDKVIRNSDGTSILLGSSTELFLKTKAIGVRDGLILKVDQSNKLIQSVRSGEKGATRNWTSSTSSLLFGGLLKSPTTTLATITKFDTKLKPTWSNRLKATSSALVVNGLTGNFYTAYEFKGVGTLLGIDKLGKTTLNLKFPGQPLVIQYNQKLGLFILTESAIYTLSAK